MSRLPTVGSDNNNWGTVLNDYLAVSLNTDGTIKKTGIESSLTGDITSHNHNTNNSIYQHITDNTLNTTSKTVPGAINELSASAANLTNSVDIATVFTSPTFTGTPVAPTATVGTNTTQIATTEFTVNNNRYLNELKTLGFTGDLLPAFTNPTPGLSNETLVTGRVRYCMFLPTQTKTYSKVYIYIAVAGNYVGTGLANGICFYSTSGGVNTKISNTETLNTEFWKVQGMNIITLSNPVTLTAGNIYKLAFIYQYNTYTTDPVLSLWSNCSYGSSMGAITNNSEQPQSQIDSKTSFETSILSNALPGTGNIPLIFLKS